MRHTLALLGIGMRAAVVRPGAASIVVLGIAAATIVLCGLMTIVSSVHGAILTSGRVDRALVTRKGATSELESAIPPRVRDVIESLPGVSHDASGKPRVSEELVRVLDFRSDDAHSVLSFPFRGVSDEAFSVRPEIHLIEGRMFDSGRREVVLGRAVAEAVKSQRVGSSIDMNGVHWRVVGIFSAAGSSLESEVITDVRTLQSFYKAQSVSSLTVRLTDPAALAAFKSTLESAPDFAVQVERESDHYAALAQRTGAPLQAVALLVGGLMSAAGVFLAMSASHAAFSARAAEMATVRALGFRGRTVAASVLLEVVALGVIGAIVGAALAWMLCRGATVSLLTGDLRLSQTAFHLTLHVRNVAVAAVSAVAIAVVGGLPSAVKSVRQSLPEALRV